MKSFTFPVIVVLAMSMGCLFVAIVSFSFASASHARVVAAQAGLSAQQKQMARMREGLANLAETNELVERFLRDWRADLGFGEEMVPTFNEFNTIATSHQVSQGPRNQDAGPNYNFKGKPFKVKRYLYSVSGDFPLLMRWLRDSEMRFPLARFENVSISNTGQSLEMQTAVVFPLEFKIP